MDQTYPSTSWRHPQQLESFLEVQSQSEKTTRIILLILESNDLFVSAQTTRVVAVTPKSGTMQDIGPPSLSMNQRTGSPCWTSLSTIQKLSCRMRKTSLGSSALKNVKEKVNIAWKVCPITVVLFSLLAYIEFDFSFSFWERKQYISQRQNTSQLFNTTVCVCKLNITKHFGIIDV